MRIEDLARNALQPQPLKQAEPTEKDFGQLLMDALSEVNKAQLEAGELREAFVKGEPVELHDVLIALEKSGIALQLAIEIRNKLLEAYQEISRIPV